MTKYSVDDPTHTRRWEQDTRFVLAEWSVKPFAGHRHRHETVELRLVVEYTHTVGADVRLEGRSDDTEKFPDEWGLVESVEVRPYHARHDRHERAGWLS